MDPTTTTTERGSVVDCAIYHNDPVKRAAYELTRAASGCKTVGEAMTVIEGIIRTAMEPTVRERGEARAMLQGARQRIEQIERDLREPEFYCLTVYPDGQFTHVLQMPTLMAAREHTAHKIGYERTERDDGCHVSECARLVVRVGEFGLEVIEGRKS